VQWTKCDFPAHGLERTDATENKVLGGVCGYLGELSPFWSCATGLSSSCPKFTDHIIDARELILRLQKSTFEPAIADATSRVKFKPELEIRTGGDGFTTAQSAGEILAEISTAEVGSGVNLTVKGRPC
jgi:hypothetical protein